MTVTVNFTGLEPITEAINLLAKSIGASGVVTTVKEKPAIVAPVQQKEPEAQKEATEPKAAPEDQEPSYALEEVRAKLTALNKAGKRAEVKALLASFGAEKLSEIPDDQYNGLMKAAEEI